MIELKDDVLVFSFPHVHADALLHVEFQRTLRNLLTNATHDAGGNEGRQPKRMSAEKSKRKENQK